MSVIETSQCSVPEGWDQVGGLEWTAVSLDTISTRIRKGDELVGVQVKRSQRRPGQADISFLPAIGVPEFCLSGFDSWLFNLEDARATKMLKDEDGELVMRIASRSDVASVESAVSEYSEYLLGSLLPFIRDYIKDHLADADDELEN